LLARFLLLLLSWLVGVAVGEQLMDEVIESPAGDPLLSVFCCFRFEGVYSQQRFLVEQTRQWGRVSSHWTWKYQSRSTKQERKEKKLTLTLLNLQVPHPFLDLVCLLFCLTTGNGIRSSPSIVVVVPSKSIPKNPKNQVARNNDNTNERKQHIAKTQ
jgi:hypothetical protein